MTSSTSSSRRPFLLALLTILIGMGSSLGLVRAFTYFAGATTASILSEVTEARAALPRIVQEQQELVIVFGSSMTDAAFAARQFDREMAELGIDIKSFNFGFGGLNPFFQDFLSRRIRDEFLENERRVKLTLVEFTPLQNTKARYRGAEAAIESYITMLASDAEIWELFVDDIDRGIRVANIRYLRDNVSAEMITWALRDEWFGSGRPDSGVEPDEEARARRDEIVAVLDERFEEDYPDHVDSNWSYEWQGAGTIPEERSEDTLRLFKEYYQTLRTKKRLSDDRLWRIQCCDIENLDFEEELIAGFVRTVRNFQQFSDHVEVVLLPRNRDWIGRPPEAEQRLRLVLERIRKDTGVEIHSFEDAPEITPDMYSDTTHLSRYDGDVAYTHLLVERYAPVLAGSATLPPVEYEAMYDQQQTAPAAVEKPGAVQ